LRKTHWIAERMIALLVLCAPGCGTQAGTVIVINPLENPEDGPPAGNPDGECAIPTAAGLEDVSTPTTVVGDGTPGSCTGAAFVAAVADGGVITFDCGPDPVTITLDETARIYNDASDEVVIDGGGLVTLSGGGTTRILYMNTCDPELVWTTDHCDDQDHPRLTVQNITFINGVRNGTDIGTDGGGAIWARGGQFKAVNTRFFHNFCTTVGPEVGGGALRIFDQYEDRPVFLVNSTFGGAEGFGNECSNGGAISSIGVSWTIINGLFSHNGAIGSGEHDGSGGAIYNDGGTMTLSLCGTRIDHNSANLHGSAIFFISNNHDGLLSIDDSVIENNTGGSWYVLPGISMHDDTVQDIDADSIIQ
jgi:hypothetical protein